MYRSKLFLITAILLLIMNMGPILFVLSLLMAIELFHWFLIRYDPAMDRLLEYMCKYFSRVET